MGRGWAEEKQIGEELQREGPRTGRWRLEQERVGRLRVIGRQSETRSRLWERVLECRRHLGKEEVFKAEGERREEKWGFSGGGRQASRGKRTRGADEGEKKRYIHHQKRLGTSRREAGAWRRVQQLLASI